MRTKVIYEDKDIIVAQKPAGLATQTARVGQADMVSELKNHIAPAQGGKSPYLGVIHRLDQPVEGLLVFAKNQKAAADLTKQLSGQTLNKQYYAAVCGYAPAPEGELVDYLWKTPDGKAQVVTGEQDKYPEAKCAILRYRIIGERNLLPSSTGSGVFFTDIHIETGRFHQIRAQMAHAGMPLLGDVKYGTEESMARSRELSVRNVALCAYKLEFLHPFTGKPLSFCIKPEGKVFAAME